MSIKTTCYMTLGVMKCTLTISCIFWDFILSRYGNLSNWWPFSPPSLNISQPGELSPGAFPNIPPPPFANGGKYPYPPGLLGFPGFLAQHPYGLERRSSSKSPTPEPAQSPSLREEEGSGNIWHPLSRIKVENNQNEGMGGFSEQEDQQEAEAEAHGGDNEESESRDAEK